MTGPPTADGTRAILRGVVAATAITLVVIVVAAVKMFVPPAPPPPASSAGDVREARDRTAREATAPTVTRIAATPGAAAKWIWAEGDPPDDAVIFEKTLDFPTAPREIRLRLCCDNEAVVFANEQEVGRSTDWQRPLEIDLSDDVADGRIDLMIEARNTGGPAGLIAVVEIEYAEDSTARVVTNDSWTVRRANEEPTMTAPATEVASYGDGPWGVIPAFLSIDIDRGITVSQGFICELVYTVPRDQGSWVSLAVDGEGRLIASDQSNGLFRIKPAPIGSDAAATTVEPIDSPAGAAQGLLWIDGDLYCMINGGRAQGSGLYRLRDTDRDDQYDQTELLRLFQGGGEHGPHAVVHGPDEKLYIVAGNHTSLPEPEESRVPRVWAEDHLLPRLWDARGHAVGILAPGGWVARTDRNGESFELYSIGYRNPYDIAFNEDGELFTYDADMEWDMGAPWYRPTRVCHVTSGSEFGWRSGTGKWPEWYEDSLPAVVDIGPGSPTGIVFGRGAKFPAEYQHALFILDWTFGTIHAVHLDERGASYTGEREEFLSGSPLPLADAVMNPSDGAMYFVIGGRSLPSAIYRVRYEGELPANAQRGRGAASAARGLRRRLEAFHAPDSANSEGLELIWSHLDHDDRFIRFAARTALEHQPPERWVDRLGQEDSARRVISAVIAAARTGGGLDPSQLYVALDAIRLNDLDRESFLGYLRAVALTMIRTGPPAEAARTRLLARLEREYPANDDAINRDLCELLVALGSPAVVSRTINLMEHDDSSDPGELDPQLLSRSDSYGQVILKMAANQPQRQQVHYALALRNATRGWSPELRRRYLDWFESAKLASGGLSFAGFLDNIRDDAVSRMSDDERAQLAAYIERDPVYAEPAPDPQGPGRPWTVDAIAEAAAEGLTDRDFENGRLMYSAARCDQCHRFAGTGKVGGPDLTALRTRFTIRDLAETIVEPSRTISDQYAQTELILRDGSVSTGRVIDRNERAVTIMPTLLLPEHTVTIPIEEIEREQTSIVSSMPPRLLDRLSEDEVLDLFAYLLSEGDRRSALFSSGDSNDTLP